jgi:hypothetical protein
LPPVIQILTQFLGGYGKIFAILALGGYFLYGLYVAPLIASSGLCDCARRLALPEGVFLWYSASDACRFAAYIDFCRPGGLIKDWHILVVTMIIGFIVDYGRYIKR